MAKHRVIVNPISGRGNGERSIPEIQRHLGQAGLDFDLVRTERPWHAAELARQAVEQGCQVVVAAGGDGTANEVLNGLMQARAANRGSPAALGIICVGRGNDFAYGIGIPTGVEAGCRVVAQGHRRTIDVGLVAGGLYPQGRYFGNGVGIGFDAVVGFQALKLRPLSGFVSYLIAALMTAFLYYRAPRVRVSFDGEEVEHKALMVSTMNGRRLGGGFMMAPQGEIGDGLFDLCLVTEARPLRILGLIPHFMKGTQATQPEIRMVRARRVSVAALEGVLPAHADGETLCVDGTELTMELLPGQMEALCEPGGEAR